MGLPFELDVSVTLEGTGWASEQKQCTLAGVAQWPASVVYTAWSDSPGTAALTSQDWAARLFPTAGGLPVQVPTNCLSF